MRPDEADKINPFDILFGVLCVLGAASTVYVAWAVYESYR